MGEAMCFVEADWSHWHIHDASRRAFLGGGLLAAATSLLLPGVAEGAELPGKGGGPGSAGVNFKWFGTDGWEISFANRTILIDPYFGRTPTGFFAGKFDPKTPI